MIFAPSGRDYFAEPRHIAFLHYFTPPYVARRRFSLALKIFSLLSPIFSRLQIVFRFQPYFSLRRQRPPAVSLRPPYAADSATLSAAPITASRDIYTVYELSLQYRPDLFLREFDIAADYALRFRQQPDEFRHELSHVAQAI